MLRRFVNRSHVVDTRAVTQQNHNLTQVNQRSIARLSLRACKPTKTFVTGVNRTGDGSQNRLNLCFAGLALIQ